MRPAIAFALTLAATHPAAAQQAALLGDAIAGEDVYESCSGCHQIGADAENGIGPHLNGIFGRRAGAVDAFFYSRSLKRAGDDGLVWDAERLDAYIENPKALVSGTRMSFPGIDDADERRNLLAFLRRYSDNPRDIPEAQPTARPSEVDLSPEILALVGDRDFGEYLSNECTTCHRRDGANEGIPSITMWPTEDFVIAMHAYKRKLRPHPVMQMMAGRLSDEEIAALAAYFATLVQ